MNEQLPRHKIIRALLECYNEFKEYSAREGFHFIEYQGYTLSILDLQNQLWRVSPRKRQAIELHLIAGLKQHEAAEIMHISPVTVGQYCVAGCNTLARWYFNDLPPEELTDDATKSETLSPGIPNPNLLPGKKTRPTQTRS